MLCAFMLIRPLEARHYSALLDRDDTDTSSNERQPSPDIYIGVNEVTVSFVATDSRGKVVRNLTQHDIAIADNGNPPKAIVGFRQVMQLPLHLSLLIDTSSSVSAQFDWERQAAIGLARRILRPGLDTASVFSFNAVVVKTALPGEDTESMYATISALRNGGGTALYDAIYRACQDSTLSQSRTAPLRTAMIVITDGQDNHSQVTRGQAIAIAQQADIAIYAISTNNSGVILPGDRVLDEISSATGGHMFLPLNRHDVDRSFDVIEQEVRNKYVLSYQPLDVTMDGGFHSIELSSPRRHLYLRYRTGYFSYSR